MRDARVDGDRTVRIETDDAAIVGDPVVPSDARGLVLFAHGSGSSRTRPEGCVGALTRVRSAQVSDPAPWAATGAGVP